MPYQNVRDLPESQVRRYGQHQRRVFRSAFNAAHLAGHSEASCFAIAHAAAQRTRKKRTR